MSEVKAPVDKTNNVVIPQADFERLQKQFEEQNRAIQVLQTKLELADPASPRLSGEMRTAKLMFIDDCPVVGFGKVRTVGDVLSIKLSRLKPDGTIEPVEMSYLEAMNNNVRYMCELVEVKKQEKVAHQGPLPTKVMTTMSDQVGRKTASGAPYIPREIVLQHTLVNATAKVKMIEGPAMGQEYDVELNCLNP